MVLIEDNNITLTRGDTLLVKIDIFDEDGNEFTPEDTDVIRFAMKKRYKDDTCLIKKTIDNKSLTLEIKPEETKDLAFGKEYVYDIQLTRANGIVDTFITGTTLYLSEEVD